MTDNEKARVVTKLIADQLKAKGNFAMRDVEDCVVTLLQRCAGKFPSMSLRPSTTTLRTYAGSMQPNMRTGLCITSPNCIHGAGRERIACH